MAAMKDARPKHWQFFYETPLSALPVPFAWADDDEAIKEADRRPDGVAYNSLTQQLVFLEFTRCMDHEHTLQAALAVKSHQYDAAIQAALRAQADTPYDQRTVKTVTTAPFIFGVRGSVMTLDCAPFFHLLGLSQAKTDNILASGVRAAITAASDMCAARLAAKAKQPPAPRPRLPGKRKRQTTIPDKPWRASPWRSDRGC